jgi:hypothetical protein
MAFKSRDLMMNLSGAAGHTKDDCTKCTATHKDGGGGERCSDCSSTHTGEGGGEGGGEHCADCTSTHTGDKRQALADPALGMLRLQLREALGGDAR